MGGVVVVGEGGGGGGGGGTWGQTYLEGPLELLSSDAHIHNNVIHSRVCLPTQLKEVLQDAQSCLSIKLLSVSLDHGPVCFDWWWLACIKSAFRIQTQQYL